MLSIKFSFDSLNRERDVRLFHLRKADTQREEAEAAKYMMQPMY